MLQILNILIIILIQKKMKEYFVIFQILPTFVYELFETMQSSVTRSRTSITKSLPASFKLSIFTLSSESYIKIHCFVKGN